MPQIVNVVGVGPVQFPDGISQDEMLSALQRNFPTSYQPIENRTSIQETPLESNELKATGNAFMRGVERAKQQAASIGLNAAAAANEELQRSTLQLQEFDTNFANAPDPDGRLRRNRDSLIGKIAGLQQESSQRNSFVPQLTESIQKSEQEIDKLPGSQPLKDFQTGDWWAAWKKNPIEITSAIIAESLPQMAPALVGTALAGPVGGGLR